MIILKHLLKEIENTKHITESIDSELKYLSSLGMEYVDKIQIGNYTMILLKSKDENNNYEYEIALTSSEQDFTTAQSQIKKSPSNTLSIKTLKELSNKIKKWLNIYSPIAIGTMNNNRSKKYLSLLQKLGFKTDPTIHHDSNTPGPFKEYWTFNIYK